MKGHFWLCDVPRAEKAVRFDQDGPLSLGRLYDVMEQEKLLSIFFHTGLVDREGFIRRFSGDDHLTYAAYSADGVPLVLAVVNGLSGASGMTHFCYFREGRGMAQQLAREWMIMLRNDGMRSLTGLTPAPYRHALAFAERVGFRRLGTIPGACKLVCRGGRLCDGVVTVINLSEV